MSHYTSGIQTVIRGTLGFPQATFRHQQARFVYEEMSTFVVDNFYFQFYFYP
jgi:hypothetical protein